MDNFFTLLAFIQIHLRHSKGIVYATFVDFRGAFPSVPHDRLWKKLFKLGLSSKFINIVKNFYQNAFACVSSGRLGLLYKKGVAQFCLANIYSMYVYFNGARFKIFNREQCLFCMARCVDLNHVLNVFPKYGEIKRKFLPVSDLCQEQVSVWLKLMSSSNISDCKRFIKMIMEILNLSETREYQRKDICI